MTKTLTAAALSALVLAATPVFAAKDLVRVRAANGTTVTVQRSGNYAQCFRTSMGNGYDAAKSKAWCQSPDRKFNQR